MCVTCVKDEEAGWVGADVVLAPTPEEGEMVGGCDEDTKREDEGHDSEDGEPEGHLGDASDRKAMSRSGSARHGDMLVSDSLGKRQRWCSEMLLSMGGGTPPLLMLPLTMQQ